MVKQLIADLAASPALAEQIKHAQTIDELRAILQKLDSGPFQRAALSLIASAQVNLDDLRGQVETWYNDVMDRVRCALGADTLRIIRTLSTDSQLRAFVVSEAERTTGKGGALALQTNTVTETVTVSVGAGSTVTTTTTTAPSMSAVVEELDRLRQLFGYGDLLGAAATTGSAQGGGGWGNWLLLALSRLLGVAITALAASIGAPFWFDVLQRVANLRAAGKPPTPSSSAGQPPPGESGRPQSAS